MAQRENTPARDAGSLAPGPSPRPRIVFLHFTAPPIVGGVEAVIAEHVRLLSAAGFPTLIVAGRRADTRATDPGDVAFVPEMDSEDPEYLKQSAALQDGKLPDGFQHLQGRIEAGLARLLQPDDVVIAHNILTTHFNLALTAAVHALVGSGQLRHLIVWCHDLSRHVNPERNEPQLHGFPWDLLRTRIPGASYVAVSTDRQRSLANILDCSPDSIEVIPNGVDPARLLGLSPLVEHLVEEFGLFDVNLVMLMPVRVTKIKNIEFGLRVTHAVKLSGSPVRLLITGPPDPHVADIPEYYSGLLQLRDELGLHEEAVFIYEGTSRYPSPLGLDESTVGELFRVADLVLMPSLREGFGMPVLEAALADRPVYATAIPVTQDLPTFQHLIGDDESPESVGDRILRWAESDAAHRMRRQVRGRYTWQHIFWRQIIPLVERTAQTEAGPPR